MTGRSGVVLLSASLSRDYDLTVALRQSRDGLVNFYNEKDVALLGVGTTILGNVDGRHSPSAGRRGFAPPGPKATADTVEAYKKLHHVRITRDMVDDASSPHVSATSVPFVAAYVAEWVLDTGWPPPRRLAAAKPIEVGGRSGSRVLAPARHEGSPGSLAAGQGIGGQAGSSALTAAYRQRLCGSVTRTGTRDR